MKDQKYKNTILELSIILNELQKPIQILDSVKWQDGVDEFIIKNKFKELPSISYENRPLKYDPVKKLQEFKELRMKISRELGPHDPLGLILARNCIQYEDVIKMLMARGKEQFYDYSKKLYGSANEVMGDGKTKLSDLALIMSNLLDSLNENMLGENFERNMTSEQVVDELKIRLGAILKTKK